MYARTLYFLILSALLAACSGQDHVYKIGVSQCSIGLWRSKVNNEMLAAQHLFDQDVDVDIVDCYDRSDDQIYQIDSLMATDIDLLVVAPNDYKIAPALKRAKDKGIPIVLFDRMVESDDFDAFIGGSNVAIGELAANYAAQIAAESEGHNVLEIAALQNTSPARERHQSFMTAMKQHPEANYRCVIGNWDDNDTHDILKKEIEEGRIPDAVFCHSDFMALGAHRAVVETGMEQQIKIIGVDGLPNEGIEYVQKGWLAGTCVYPTHGEEIVRLALDILNGKPYERINYLNTLLITPENVDMIGRYANEMKSQSEDLVVIQEKLDNYFGLYHVQTKIIWASVLLIVLLVVAIAVTWMAVKQIRTAHRKQKALNKEQTLFYTNVSHQLKTPLTLIAGPVKKLIEKKVLKGDDQTLLEIVGRNVGQLETLVSSVLDFRKRMNENTVSDETASEAVHQALSADIVKDGHLNMLNQEDTDELLNILIVDDNDDMRRYLRTLLTDKFYVLEATDGQSGLQLARESVPDIIVSDVMMPIMDGLQFCKKVKEGFITSHIPVILLTARGDESQQMEGYESGADAYLTKPFNADLLIARIYNLLKSRQQLWQIADDKFDNYKSLQSFPQKTGDQQVKLTTQDKLFIDRLKETITGNLQKPDLRMDDIGEELGISRVQLYRKVKTLTGLSPVELLKQMRLQRSMMLLNTTTKTVSEIAYEVGFSSSSYFSNCFKKQYGKQPLEARAK